MEKITTRRLSLLLSLTLHNTYIHTSSTHPHNSNPNPNYPFSPLYFPPTHSLSSLSLSIIILSLLLRCRPFLFTLLRLARIFVSFHADVCLSNFLSSTGDFEFDPTCGFGHSFQHLIRISIGGIVL